MDIFRSWRDSLFLLAPANLKLFLLVTLKSTLETYKVKCTRLVPVIVMASVVGAAYLIREEYLPRMITTAFASHTESAFTYLVLYILFLVVYGIAASLQRYIGYAATRPSVGLKNSRYFLAFWRYYLLLMFVSLSIILLFYLFAMVIPGLASCIHIPLLIAQSLFNITILFFLDSNGSLLQLGRAIVRTVMMVIYNAPIVALFCTLEVIAFFGYQATGCYQTWWLSLVPFFLSIPIINLWTNFYIKKVHEQPDLYFDGPK